MRARNFRQLAIGKEIKSKCRYVASIGHIVQNTSMLSFAILGGKAVFGKHLYRKGIREGTPTAFIDTF